MGGWYRREGGIGKSEICNLKSELYVGIAS